MYFLELDAIAVHNRKVFQTFVRYSDESAKACKGKEAKQLGPTPALRRPNKIEVSQRAAQPCYSPEIDLRSGQTQAGGLKQPSVASRGRPTESIFSVTEVRCWQPLPDGMPKSTWPKSFA
jgi:hypothetical protein